LNLKKKLAKCCIRNTTVYGAATWTLRKSGKKYLESLEMWRWRRTEKISWTDHVKHKVLHSANEKYIQYKETNVGYLDRSQFA
jgi:hypothetical protein